MSRTKYEAYATYSKYNGGNGDKNGPIAPPSGIDNSRFSNAPPPIATNFAIPPSAPPEPQPQPQFDNTSLLPENNQQQPFLPHVDQSRVNHIEPDKLYDLLTNPQYHYVTQNEQKQPLRILIKVYTDWCKPCKIVAPEIKKLSANPRYANILFVEIDGEKLMQHEALSSILRCSSVPTFFTFAAGKQVGFMTGIKMDEIINLCNGLV